MARLRADLGDGTDDGRGLHGSQSAVADGRSWDLAADVLRGSATAVTSDSHLHRHWKDAIEENNRNYRARGDERFAAGNAPVTEAHFVIWSARRSVVLSALNTVTGCEVKSVDRVAHVTIKLCPLRMAVYEGVQVRTLEAGRACFLEPEAGAAVDTTATAAYASYDVPTRTVKIGMIVNHAAVDGCSFNVPLH